ncbi:N/A [soil metagenome]
MIGVIADDFTGAAEVGAVGLRHGLRAEIVLNGRLGGAADLVCVDTDSRSCKPEEAAKRAAAAAQRLRSAGAKWIYKKVDSVLRGNVTAEVEAVMRQLNFNRALLLPANPSLGRIIRNGQYFIHGRPVHRTEFAKDPEYPRLTAQVLRMLSAPEHFLLRLANGDLTVPESTLLIAQADSFECLRAWAGICGDSLLPVGGSEFFGALLAEELTLSAPVAAEDIDFLVGKQLFVCGTASGSAQHLIKSARAVHTPVFTLPRELMGGGIFSREAQEAILQRVALAFEHSQRVVLGVGLPLIRNMAVARRLTDSLVDIAELVLSRVEIKNVFAEGGATSADLARRMHWPRLEVLHEWAPGVTTLALAGERMLWLTIKPGSYSWPEQWTQGRMALR